MCCCPIRFVQCIVVTVAFLMLVVGSLTVGSSVYAKNNQFLIYAGDSDTIAIISLIFGILTTALSLLGIYGGFKRNRLCLFLFAINLIIVLVIELAISIILFQTRNSYHESYATLECPASPSERGWGPELQSRLGRGWYGTFWLQHSQWLAWLHWRLQYHLLPGKVP